MSFKCIDNVIRARAREIISKNEKSYIESVAKLHSCLSFLLSGLEASISSVISGDTVVINYPCDHT